MRFALSGASGPFELNMELGIAAGSFVALIGPSGAGKTTLLRLLAGLEQPQSGHIRIAGEVWCDTSTGHCIPTRRRSIGYVFQDYALFPNMTVRGNVAYALGAKAQPGDVARLLDSVGLEQLANAYPARLSGGQKQRLSLIRALARRPALLMLDEPLSALDPAMRRQLQDELRKLHREFATTTLIVSHDISEIMRLADRVVRLDEGCITFDGPPASLLQPKAPRPGIAIPALHICGPDADGRSTVLLDGSPCRVRYRNVPQDLRPGDAVSLSVDELDVHRLG